VVCVCLLVSGEVGINRDWEELQGVWKNVLSGRWNVDSWLVCTLLLYISFVFLVTAFSVYSHHLLSFGFQWVFFVFVTCLFLSGSGFARLVVFSLSISFSFHHLFFTLRLLLLFDILFYIPTFTW